MFKMFNMKSNKKISTVQNFQLSLLRMCVTGIIKFAVLDGLLHGCTGAQVRGNIVHHTYALQAQLTTH